MFGKNQNNYYHQKTYDWQADPISKQLDLIPRLVEGCRNADILPLIILPICLITALRIQSLTERNEIIKQFKGTVVWENGLVILATISYGIEFKYLFPIIVPFWDFFHQQIVLEELVESLWQFATLQAVVVVAIHLCICKLTCNSFLILESFQERYNNLKNIRGAFEVNTLTEITFKAELIKQLPTILLQVITTQTNAIISSVIVNGSLNSAQTQVLRQLLSESVQIITSNVLQQINTLPEQTPIQSQDEDKYDDE